MTGSFLVIDKPAGITSHDVVAAVRAVTGIKKVGHTGTLDPFATGVLPLALGTATRLIQFLDESIKVYDATITFGAATDTGDPTGTAVREAPLPTADLPEVQSVLERFRGDQMQEPPAYSAVKVGGKPLYHYARKGEEVRAQPRPITIHDVELVEYSPERLRVIITCSRGTYARVLADDIARALGSAGHLSVLARTRSGPFYLEDALGMDTLAEFVAQEPGHSWRDVLLARGRGAPRLPWRPRNEVLEALQPWMRSPVQCLPHLPLVDVSPADARRLRGGGMAPPPPPGLAQGSRYLVVCGPDVVAIVENTARGPKLTKVIPEADTA